uniref:LysM and putative peptidoglycan-binding domain-containing protein 2 n=1 Tax=Anthurium amnicola TaxID=1678845 RepID=A0A1D1YHG5_9ARAE
MQIDNSMWDGDSSQLLPDGSMRAREADGFVASSASPSSSSPPSAASGVNCIEHRVSKMDTLAGVAIKYGVEVADIKRMNGLVTDIQMFAHKSLQIPLPGKHPPSPNMSNGSSCNGVHTPQRQPHRDVLESFQSLKSKSPQQRASAAMRTLQGYYGLTPPKRGPEAEGTEMAVYGTGRALYLEDESLLRVSPISDQRPNGHRKSRSLVNVNGFPVENGDSAGDAAIVETTENGETDRTSEKSVRRRQKIDTASPCRAPELLLKEDVAGGAFSGRTTKGLALRPKSGSRADLDSGRASLNTVGDSSVADEFLAVRKSSSASNLQESDSSSSIWPASKWSLKPDALTRPIFDGLPKPMASKRNKTALD